MGHTKAQRRADIRALADQYKIPIKLSEGEIDLCAEIGTQDTFNLIFAMYEHLFYTEAAFGDGDDWPDNFFGLAGRYYVPGSPNKMARFIHPAVLASVDPTALAATSLPRNPRLAATTTYPVVYVANNKFFILPTSETVTIGHYLFPAPMSDPSVPDSTTDNMPEWSEPIIARAGLETMLKQILDEKTAYELNQQEVDHMEKQLAQVYKDKFDVVNATPQLRGGE